MFENVMRLSAERRKMSLTNPLKQKGKKKPRVAQVLNFLQT
jgi:hypothetical protein